LRLGVPKLRYLTNLYMILQIDTTYKISNAVILVATSNYVTENTSSKLHHIFKLPTLAKPWLWSC